MSSGLRTTSEPNIPSARWKPAGEGEKFGTALDCYERQPKPWTELTASVCYERQKKRNRANCIRLLWETKKKEQSELHQFVARDNQRHKKELKQWQNCVTLRMMQRTCDIRYFYSIIRILCRLLAFKLAHDWQYNNKMFEMHKNCT